MNLIRTPTAFIVLWMAMAGNAYLYSPYHQFFRYSYPQYNSLGSLYASQLPNYSPYVHSLPPTLYTDNVLTAFPRPVQPPILNVLTEVPSNIKNKFTVVPLYTVSHEDINIISNPLIVQVSRQKPTMRVKSEDDTLIQCTPAAKIILDKPLTIYSLRTNIMFPSEIEIVHDGFKIPVQVGAVIAPIERDEYVSPETPVLITTVYAIPTKPFVIELENKTNSSIINTETHGIVVENTNEQDTQPAKNVTVLEFPQTEAEPTFQIDEEDEELVNRNPPVGVIPAGIVQSTQPISSVQQFTNSKESPFLTNLREEAAKLKISQPEQS